MEIAHVVQGERSEDVIRRAWAEIERVEVGASVLGDRRSRVGRIFGVPSSEGA